MELQSGAVRIASYRRKFPRKKNIYLPTEVWVDVFCFPWISRPKMGGIAYKIGNRWFGDQLQFYLHEWGKHTLGSLEFTPQGVYNWHNGQRQQLNYSQTAMPENIKFCESFQIYHFDNRVFNFFRRIQNLFTADTKLTIHYIYEVDAKEAAEQVDNVRTTLGHLLPFIDGIHTISTNDWMLPVVRSFPPEKFHQVKVFRVYLGRPVQSAMQLIMEWLTSSSNEPKLLQLCCANDRIDQQALEDIRKQFIEATEPSTFAVNFSNDHDSLAFHCENAIGEQLDGMRKDAWEFQANAEAGEKLRQWLAGSEYKDGEYNDGRGCISLCKPTIGRGRIFALPDLDEVDKEDEEEKPSTSKKRRICK